MTRAQTPAQLRRLSNLLVIRSAIAQSLPSTTASIGLMEIATACRIRGAAVRATRDQLLTIACEWDLANDRLENQSGTCLAAVAQVLRVV